MTRQADLIDRLRALLADRPSTREVSMFGGRSFMVHDKMVVSALKDGDLLVRVDVERHDELTRQRGATQAEMGAGRSMGPGWIAVSAATVAGDDGLSFWLDAALDRNHATTTRTAAPVRPDGPDAAADFLVRLTALRHEAGDTGRLPRRNVFALAKEFVGTPPEQIETMLDHPDHDVRTGGVCIMDFQARRRGTPAERRRELYELYLRRHDRIDSWDLVDRAAPSVVGGYLFDRSRAPLYVLARSPHPMERRTAIVATYHFIRHGELHDTFAIADLLAHDPEDLVQKAVGGWTREAGKRDVARLRAFLDRHAATMPRTALRYATEHLPGQERQHYLALRRTG